MFTRSSGQAGTARGILATHVERSTETSAGLLGAGCAFLEDPLDHFWSALSIAGGIGERSRSNISHAARPTNLGTSHNIEAVPMM